MAPAGDPSITETPEYRIVVLFALFVAITYAFEKSMHWVNHHLKKIGRHGLLHTIHKLEEEVLALGLISLILIVIEEYLVQICIDSDSDSKKGAKKKGGDSKKKAAVVDASDPDGEVAALLSSEVGAVGTDTDIDPDDPLAPGYEEDEAVRTDATLMDDLDNGSRRLLGGVMRSLLAGGGGGDVCGDGEESFWSINTLHQTHIFIFLLASVHITFAGFSMLLCSWKVRQWKQWEEHRHDLLKKIDYDRLLSKNQPIIHYGRAFFAQFHQQIDETVYLSLRRLFIERMELDNDFEFHKFLVNFMEEEFSKVIRLEWTMWAVAAVWIITTPAVVYIMEGLGVVASLIAGTKLESIALKLGNEAWILYADKPPPGQSKRSGNVFTRSLMRVSTGVAQKILGYNPQTSDGAKKGDSGNGASRFFYPPNAEPHGKGTGNRDSGESGQGHDSVFSLSQNGPEISGDPVSLESAGPAPRRQDVGGYDLLSSRSVDAQAVKATKPGTAGFGMAPVLTQDDSAVGFPALFSGLCLWPKDSQHTAELRNLRKKTFSDMYYADDSANLFPFKRPRLMLLIFQFTYFETSLMAAVLLFNIWQDVDPDLILSQDWPAFVELGVGIAVILLTSILLLPVYWLTMVVGSHCPSKVLRKAKKKKINPKTVSAFERVSTSLKKKSVVMARTSMSRVSASLQKSSSAIQGASKPDTALPTHWADLEAVPDAEAVQLAQNVEISHPPVVEVEEEDHDHGSGALGMLVGAMLKTKKRELEGGPHAGSSSRKEPPAPSLERMSSSKSGKLKPLLARLSVPLINLPKSSSQPDLTKLDEPQDTASVMPSAEGSAPRSLAWEHRPLPGLHDIVETTSPSPTSKPLKGSSSGARVMRKSKSQQDLHREEAAVEQAPAPEETPGEVRTQLSRGSMPIMKVIERKQKAYLERERQVAEHLMQEHPDEDLHHYSPVRKPAPEPENRMAERHGPLRGGQGSSSATGKSKNSNPNLQPHGHTTAWRKTTLLHPSLDHVAELFKYGEKQKHQRE